MAGEGCAEPHPVYNRSGTAPGRSGRTERSRMSKPDLAIDLKNVSEKDRRQIAQASEMLGPDPERMGFIKTIFWGKLQSSR